MTVPELLDNKGHESLTNKPKKYPYTFLQSDIIYKPASVLS